MHIGEKRTHLQGEGDSDTEISVGPPKQVKGELEQVIVNMCCNSIQSQVVLRISSLFVWCRVHRDIGSGHRGWGAWEVGWDTWCGMHEGGVQGVDT